VDDGEQIREDLDLLVGRVTEVEALVRSLRNRVDAESSAAPEAKLSATGDGIDLDSLAKWVDQIQQRYASAGDWLRPCWWRHGFVIEELAALRTEWAGAYESDETPASTAALKWHEDAAKCRERIRRAISSGPGCTAVSHKSDQSITDDPRWAEEQSAMNAKLSEADDHDAEAEVGGEDAVFPLPASSGPLEAQGT
jgi:hypothetical protein